VCPVCPKIAFFGKVLYEKKNLKSFGKKAKTGHIGHTSTKIFYNIKYIQK